MNGQDSTEAHAGTRQSTADFALAYHRWFTSPAATIFVLLSSVVYVSTREFCLVATWAGSFRLGVDDCVCALRQNVTSPQHFVCFASRSSNSTGSSPKAPLCVPIRAIRDGLLRLLVVLRPFLRALSLTSQTAPSLHSREGSNLRLTLDYKTQDPRLHRRINHAKYGLGRCTARTPLLFVSCIPQTCISTPPTSVCVMRLRMK